jgi:DNA-binding MarR family transcriptional regulator
MVRQMTTMTKMPTLICAFIAIVIIVMPAISLGTAAENWPRPWNEKIEENNQLLMSSNDPFIGTCSIKPVADNVSTYPALNITFCIWDWVGMGGHSYSFPSEHVFDALIVARNGTVLLRAQGKLSGAAPGPVNITLEKGDSYYVLGNLTWNGAVPGEYVISATLVGYDMPVFHQVYTQKFNEPYLEFCNVHAMNTATWYLQAWTDVRFSLCLKNPTDRTRTLTLNGDVLFTVQAQRSNGKVVYDYHRALKGAPTTITLEANATMVLGNLTWRSVPNGNFTVHAYLGDLSVPHMTAIVWVDNQCNALRCENRAIAGQGGPGSESSGPMGGIIILGTSGIVAFSEAGKYCTLGFVAPLFTRLKKKKVLDNFTRGQIQGYIIANPGANLTTIRNEFDLSNGVVVYHLRVLEREGFVSSCLDGMKRRFYPGDKIEQKDKKQELTFAQSALITLMEKSPGVNQVELAKMTHTSPQVVNYHIRKLFRMGAITLDKDGRTVRCYVVPEKLALLKRTEAPEENKGPSKDAADTT